MKALFLVFVTSGVWLSPISALFHSARQHSDSDSSLNDLVIEENDYDWSCSLADLDCLTQQSSFLYNSLEKAIMKNYSINPIIDPLLKKLRDDLVFYNRSEILLPTLDIMVPDAPLKLHAIFSGVRTSGGEELRRNGDATATMNSKGEIMLDIPLIMVTGTAAGRLLIDLAGLTIDTPLTGIMTGPGTWDIGMTLFPLLPNPRLPQVTKLLILEPGLIDIQLDPDRWNTPLALVLAFLIIFLVILVALIGSLILICCLFCRMKKLNRELDEYKIETIKAEK